MASCGLYEAFIALFCFFIFSYFFIKKHFDYIKKTLETYPWNWPVLGMLPAVLMRFNRIDEAMGVIENSNLTFLFKGPWFTKMEALLTVDPSNIHHIMSLNFSNYIKGPEFKEFFDVYGDVIFNTDSDLWKNLRISSQIMLNHQEFQRFSMSTTTSKLKNVLIPLFDHYAEEGTVIDLQDVFQRFMFDTTLVTITSSDPQTLSIKMPENQFAKAFDDAGEAIVFRHIMPRFLWKFQNWMRLGKEKKLIEARTTFDHVCAKYISLKREEMRSSQGNSPQSSKEETGDLLTSHMKLDPTKYEFLNPNDDKFLKESILTYIFAGRDSTATALTWFFGLLSQNPQVVSKIRQEIKKNLPRTGSGQERPWSSIDPKEDLNKLVYLHGALCEAMRIYPPVPFQRKSPITSDVLPSGHKVEANSIIIIPIYALGRMRSVWGEDALEFKPERWISETGELRYEPSHKFLAFNAGPRTCPGKHLAMVAMKILAVDILQNYDVKVVDGHKIVPKPRLVLHMKDGLKVTLTKRSMW